MALFLILWIWLALGLTLLSGIWQRRCWSIPRYQQAMRAFPMLGRPLSLPWEPAWATLLEWEWPHGRKWDYPSIIHSRPSSPQLAWLLTSDEWVSPTETKSSPFRIRQMSQMTHSFVRYHKWCYFKPLSQSIWASMTKYRRWAFFLSRKLISIKLKSRNQSSSNIKSLITQLTVKRPVYLFRASQM